MTAQKIRLTAGAVVFLLSLYTAPAAAFNFEYNFTNGTTITGSFEGTAAGNLITDLSNITVSVNGSAYDGGAFLNAYSFTPLLTWENGGAIVSFDGQENNFAFGSGSTYYDGLNAFTSIAQGLTHWQTGGGASEFIIASDMPTHWKVTGPESVADHDVSAVMLIGLSMLGFTALRRSPASCSKL